MSQKTQSTTTSAVKKASEDLRKGSGDAGLAMEEKKRIKELEAQIDTLNKKITQLEKGEK